MAGDLAAEPSPAGSVDVSWFSRPYSRVLPRLSGLIPPYVESAKPRVGISCMCHMHQCARAMDIISHKGRVLTPEQVQSLLRWLNNR